MTDTEVKLQGLEVLINALGEVQAERFISLILREPFDYTVWQRKLWSEQEIVIENEWVIDVNPDDSEDSQYLVFTADDSTLSQISYHLTFNEDGTVTIGSPGHYTEQLD